VRIFAIASLLILSFLSSGCGKITGDMNPFKNKKLLDFLKTEIIVGPPALANGSAALVVAIHLKNSDSTSIPNYKPEYSVAGTGVIASNCSVSDSNGISVCILKSTRSGTKRLKLTNAKVGLEADVVFNPTAQNGKIMGLVSGSLQNKATTAGGKAEISLGDPTSHIHSQTSDGYKVMFSVQGAIVSR